MGRITIDNSTFSDIKSSGEYNIIFCKVNSIVVENCIFDNNGLN